MSIPIAVIPHPADSCVNLVIVQVGDKLFDECDGEELSRIEISDALETCIQIGGKKAEIDGENLRRFLELTS